MNNENTLRGICCPYCGSEGPFKIEATALFCVSDDGSADFNDMDWGASSRCICDECGASGLASDFTLSPPISDDLHRFHLVYEQYEGYLFAEFLAVDHDHAREQLLDAEKGDPCPPKIERCVRVPNTPVPSAQDIRVGQRLWWVDPDRSLSTGVYQVRAFDGDEVVELTSESGSEAGAFLHELRLGVGA